MRSRSVVTAATCSLASSSAPSRLLVYWMYVFWSAGKIVSVITLAGGMKLVGYVVPMEGGLFCCMAALVLSERLLALLKPTARAARSSLYFALLRYSFSKYVLAMAHVLSVLTSSSYSFISLSSNFSQAYICST